jgi:predicted nucleic acid-binding protein
MPVLVDTNIILDHLTEDRQWADWSSSQLARFQPEGIWINPIIFSEICMGAESLEEALMIVKDFQLEVHEPGPEALYIAAKAFLRYRKHGGRRSSPLPDFYVGGQAEALGIRLLTRDSRRYRTYFPEVKLICP